MAHPYCVRAVHCDHAATDDETYEALKRATAPLTSTWDRLARARRIGIKINQDMRTDSRVYCEGLLQQLVCEKVVRGVLRLLRERTDAELVVVDVSCYAMSEGTDPQKTATALPVLREFGVEYVDGTTAPATACPVPGGGQIFAQYLVPSAAVDVDEFISVAKMKNHGFMGVTLTLKNLFGLVCGEPRGHSRSYFHHLVRMPYVLADLGRVFAPALNIIDGLVGQAGQEWGDGAGDGPARIPNTLVAGDHTIATDACTTHLMGHDPQGDWRVPPFNRDRNALKVAAEGGFGTVDLSAIDFESEVAAPVAEFFGRTTDAAAVADSWQRTTCEQGLYYRDHCEDVLFEHYSGQYILLQGGLVCWHDTVSDLKQSRRVLSGDKPNQAMWLKYVDPEEAEGEHFEVYERGLARLDGLSVS